MRINHLNFLFCFLVVPVFLSPFSLFPTCASLVVFVALEEIPVVFVTTQDAEKRTRNSKSVIKYT
jgi:hypothetical protein